MAPWRLRVGGRCFDLYQIEKWSKKRCQATFRCTLHQRQVVHEFVRRKLHGLVQGLRYERITWSRIKEAKFSAIKKREMRYLLGQIDQKYSDDNWSHMARAKLASHLIVSGKYGFNWDRVPDRSSLDYGFYNPDQVRALLAEFNYVGLRGRARKHLETEVNAAASCSCLALFECYVP